MTGADAESLSFIQADIVSWTKGRIHRNIFKKLVMRPSMKTIPFDTILDQTQTDSDRVNDIIMLIALRQ